MQKIIIALIAVLLLITAILMGPPLSTPSSNSTSTEDLSRTEQWQEDLDFLYSALQEHHPDPFYRTSQDRLQRAVDSLRERIPELTDAQIKLELQRIAALVKDGHTHLALTPHAFNFDIVPVRLYWFSDGMYIIDALEPYQETIGSRIYQIENTLLEEIYIRLNSYISAENSFWPQLVIPYWVRSPEVLQALGYIQSADTSSWRLVTTGDEFYTVEVSPIAPDEAPESFHAGTPLIDRSSDAPLYLENTEEAFWLEYLGETNTLYVQYNAVQAHTQSGQTLADFVGDIEEVVSKNEGIKVVVDLRHNSGGDNTTYGPLLNLLTTNEAINQEGKLFVIIGRNTFSAAANFAAELEQNSNAMFLGEPTGNSPNQYGDCRMYTLPHSELDICISSKYWVKSTPDDERTAIHPDVEIPLTYADYARHIDPVLTAILSMEE